MLGFLNGHQDLEAGEEFLTAERQRRYGRYAGDPDQAQLDRYFHLDAAARELVDIRRGEHNRLGFAIQLGTVHFLGTFLAAPTDVPWAVASHLAGQLGIADPGVLKQYRRPRGNDFTEPAVQQDLVGWLQARTRLASERPGVLFDLATARLLESKVLLPGPTVLARLVASIRDQAATRLWEALAAMEYAQTLASTHEAEFLRYRKVTADGRDLATSPRDLYDMLELDKRTELLVSDRQHAFQARTGQPMSADNIWLAGRLQEQDALGRIIVRLEETCLADGTTRAVRGAGAAARTDARAAQAEARRGHAR